MEYGGNEIDHINERRRNEGEVIGRPKTRWLDAVKCYMRIADNIGERWDRVDV